MIDNSMKMILRRLYRLYLHAFFHHFDAYRKLEVCKSNQITYHPR